VAGESAFDLSSRFPGSTLAAAPAPPGALPDGTHDLLIQQDTFRIHPDVSPEREGQGIASRLVQTALDDARTQLLAVVPFCPCVASCVRRHPDDGPVVQADERDRISGEPGTGQNG
jgi:GNAT superfamily N-acetyltransferase